MEQLYLGSVVTPLPILHWLATPRVSSWSGIRQWRYPSRFSDSFSALDRRILGLKSTPSCVDQLILEAFAALVALRTWSSRWLQGRVSLAVRSDNRATLALIAKMQPHSPNLGLIAREMALDIAALAYAPDVVAHIPGVANKAADILSRRYEPGKVALLPEYLARDLEHRCEPRFRSWWRSRPAVP